MGMVTEHIVKKTNCPTLDLSRRRYVPNGIVHSWQKISAERARTTSTRMFLSAISTGEYPSERSTKRCRFLLLLLLVVLVPYKGISPFGTDGFSALETVCVFCIGVK